MDFTEFFKNDAVQNTDTVTLYLANVSFLRDENNYRKACSLLSEDRRAKADRYKSEKDRLLSVCAGLMLNFVFSKNGIIAPKVATGENGKPYLESGELFFNISHSGEYVLCAVSKTPTGCDVEKEGGVNLNLAKRFFDEEEYNTLISAEGKEQEELFYRFWTLKESFIKAVGLGMKLPLNKFRINLSDSISVVSDYGKPYSFSEFDTVEGYRIAVCTESDKIKTDLKIIGAKELL